MLCIWISYEAKSGISDFRKFSKFYNFLIFQQNFSILVLKFTEFLKLYSKNIKSKNTKPILNFSPAKCIHGLSGWFSRIFSAVWYACIRFASSTSGSDSSKNVASISKQPRIGILAWSNFSHFLCWKIVKKVLGIDTKFWKYENNRILVKFGSRLVKHIFLESAN